jgi:hypothetical protein
MRAVQRRLNNLAARAVCFVEETGGGGRLRDGDQRQHHEDLAERQLPQWLSQKPRQLDIYKVLEPTRPFEEVPLTIDVPGAPGPETVEPIRPRESR